MQCETKLLYRRIKFSAHIGQQKSYLMLFLSGFGIPQDDEILSYVVYLVDNSIHYLYISMF